MDTHECEWCEKPIKTLVTAEAIHKGVRFKVKFSSKRCKTAWFKDALKYGTTEGT